MKRILYSILIFSIFFSLSACGKTEQKTPLSESNDVSETESSSAFNFDTKTVMLNSGYEMPIYGIGTYSLLDEVCVNSVSAALDRGVRLIDTAYMYHNEESVGEAVRNSGIPREEIFVITKLYPNQFSDLKAYLAMEKAVADGKIRSLGGRGYTTELLGNEVISQIAAAHGKSSAQVILRWNLQKGVVVISGSGNPDHPVLEFFFSNCLVLLFLG